MKKRWQHIMFSLLLFVFVPLRESAQEINFNKVKLPKGIKYIGNVAQDKYGYLWIATDGLGLIRFDGYEYKPYLNEPGNLNSLADNHLEKIFIDNKGLIWIATWTKGLDRFDPTTGKFTHFRNTKDSSSLSHDLVRAILQDREGKLWFGTHGGLDLFDPQKENFKHYRYASNDSNSLSCDRVRALFEDKDGTLWVGTGSTWDETNELSKDEGGLNRFDRKTEKFKRYLYNPANKHSLINNKVQAIFEDSKGIFWVGTAGDGLHTLDRKTDLFQRYPFDPLQPQRLSRPKENTTTIFTDYITFINEDATGRIWIGTFGNGLGIYDRKSGKCVPYKLGKEAVSETASAMYMSRDSILWISGWTGGLYNVNPFYKIIPRIDLGTRVFAITGGQSNVLWLGSANGLIKKDLFTGKLYTYDTNNSNISGSNVFSICEDKLGILWIGTEAGLDRFDPTSNQFSNISRQPNGAVFGLVFGGQDSLWMIQQSGVNLLNTKTNKYTYRYNAGDSLGLSTNLNTNRFRTVYPDRDGNIWIGTFMNGLTKLDLATEKTRRFLESIAVIEKIYQDSNGTLWITTDEGLFLKKLNDADFSRFIDASGRKLTGYSSGMIEGEGKNLYLNGINRVCRINLTNFETVIIDVIQDGAELIDNEVLAEFITGASRDNDGNLYFGTGSGYFFW